MFVTRQMLKIGCHNNNFQMVRLRDSLQPSRGNGHRTKDKGQRTHDPKTMDLSHCSAANSIPMTAQPELIHRIRACTLCAQQLPLPPRPVLQFANSARLLIVGQAPGLAAHNSGLAFDDPSGDRLRDWLGVDRPTFYDEHLIALVPMGFCYPGTGSSGDLAPLHQCAAHWRLEVLQALPNIELTLVLGQYAQRWHLPGSGSNKATGVTDTVRRWQDYLPAVIPLPHPSPRNNPWLKHNPWFARELLPVLRQKVGAIVSGSNQIAGADLVSDKPPSVK
jgi:uracil-DNA glycosylase